VCAVKLGIIKNATLRIMALHTVDTNTLSIVVPTESYSVTSLKHQLKQNFKTTILFGTVL